MAIANINYLEQVAEILKNDHKKLAARLSYTAREIGLKSVVKIKACDSPKLMHCKACRAPFTQDDIHFKKGGKYITMNCSLCKLKRKIYHEQPSVAIVSKKVEPSNENPKSL